MIQLSSDYLFFQMPSGEAIPCSAQTVTVELMGDSVSLLDQETVRNAARAVLHYFKEEQGRSSVTVGEFSQALAAVLRGFGLSVMTEDPPPPSRRALDLDLRILAMDSGKSFELRFFPRLREEVRRGLRRSPGNLRFRGLRGCVKQLAGARRWSRRCQILNDQIVDYLRICLREEARGGPCSLVVL